MPFPLLIPLITTLGGGALALLGPAVVGATLASAGLSLFLGGSLTIAGSLLSTSKGAGGFNSSPTYGFDNLGNRRGEGGPRQVIYGEQAIRPQLVSVNIVPGDNGPVFRGLYHCSQGRCDVATMVEDWKKRLRINNIPGSQIEGLKVQFSPGTDDQDALEGFNEVGRSFNANTRLEGLANQDPTKHDHAMETPADGVKLFFSWPSGLFKQDSKGRTGTACGGFVLEYKRASEKDFKAVKVIEPGITSASEADRIRKGIVQTGIFSQTLALVPYVDLGENPDWSRDAPQDGIRFKKDGWFWTCGETRAVARRGLILRFPRKEAFQIRLSGIPGGRAADDANDKRVPVLTTIIEIEKAPDRTYPGQSMMGLDIPASEQIQGSEPDVEIAWRGRELWDPRQGGNPDTGPFAFTRNPDLAILDAYLNKQYGLGRRYTVADMNLQAFQDGANLADTQVKLNPNDPNSPTERLWEIDLAVDIKSETRQWIDHIARTCRAEVFSSEGLITIAHDVAQSTVRRHFEADPQKYSTRHNVLTLPNGAPDVRRNRISKRPNKVTIKYQDRNDFYREATKTVVTNAQVGVTEAERPEELQLFGITRESQALRESTYIRNKANLVPTLCTIAVSYGDLDLEPLDLVTFSYAKYGYVTKQFLVVKPTYVPGTGRGVLLLQEYSSGVYPDGVVFSRTVGGGPSFSCKYVCVNKESLAIPEAKVAAPPSAPSKSSPPAAGPPKAKANAVVFVLSSAPEATVFLQQGG